MDETDVAERAVRSEGYEHARRLRQARDESWVLDNAPAEPRRLIDLACGTGGLLEAAEHRFGSTLQELTGFDLDEQRLDQARTRLESSRLRVRIERADLCALPPIDDGVDLITMTSALHWLYPNESRCISWIAGRLTAGGTALITTHHPVTDTYGLGGSDHIAQEAFERLGVPAADFRRRMTERGVVPIATAVRDHQYLENLFTTLIGPTRYDDHQAEVRVDSGEEYARFHAATFGRRYSQLIDTGGDSDYFAAVADVAQNRMARDGVVTSMNVRLWIITAPPS